MLELAPELSQAETYALDCALRRIWIGHGRRGPRVRALTVVRHLQPRWRKDRHKIYRYGDTRDPWQLVVIGLSSAGCTAWQETFATDQEPHDAFSAVVELDGMGIFFGRRPNALN